MPESEIVASIGLVSDTHGWLHPYLLEAFRKCELIIHAGDIGGKGEVIEELETVAPVAAVKGNIDGGDLRFLPLERVEEVAGKRIAILHIAGSPKRPRKAARELLARERPDVIVVGHSHVPVVSKVKNAIWINPGAAGREGHHHERFAGILHIKSDGNFAMDRVLLGMRWDDPDIVPP